VHTNGDESSHDITVSDTNKVAPNVIESTDSIQESRVESISDSSSSSSKKDKGKDYSEISPTKRYIRFNERLSNTANIKASYRGFDTKNGIEVVWQKIYLSDLGEAEQEPIMRSLNYVKDVHQVHIVDYLSVWVTEAPRTVNLITTYLDPLEKFIAKVKTLRWRIIKKWCKQLLTGLHYLHTSTPVIVHRNLNLGNIFMNGGLGEIYLGGLWLSAVLVEGSESVRMSDLVSTYCYQNRQPGSPAYKAPEVLANQPLTTKVDIYSFGMCMLVLLTKEDPYAEIYNAHSVECDDVSNVESGVMSDDRQAGYDAISAKITAGILPDALERVTQAHPEAGAFLRSCLALDPRDRKTAQELLDDVFLQQSSGDEGDDSVVIRSAVTKTTELKVSNVSNVSNGEVVDAQLSSNALKEGKTDEVISGEDKNESSSQTPLAVVVPPLPDVGPPQNVTQSPRKTVSTIVSKVVIPSLSSSGQNVSVSRSTSDRDLNGHSSSPTDDESSRISPDESSDSASVNKEEKDTKANVETTKAGTDDNNNVQDMEKKLESPNDSPGRHSPTCNVPEAITSKRLSLVNELAKLGTSDDVNDDRGIHDGRRAKNNSQKSSRNTQTSIQVESPREKTVEQTTTKVSTDSPSVVVVQLRIQGQYTSDGINKEVEFTFEEGSDHVESIAAEMKDELNLNLSVDQLVDLIRDEISRRRTGIQSTPTAPSLEARIEVTSSPPPVVNQNKTDSTPNKELISSSKSSPENVNVERINITGIEVSTKVTDDKNSNPNSPRRVGSEGDNTQAGSVISLTLSKSHSSEDDVEGGKKTSPERQQEVMETVSNASPVEIQNVTKDQELSTKDNTSSVDTKAESSTLQEPTSPTQKLDSSDTSSTNTSPTTSKTSRFEVPVPGDDASPVALANYQAYLKEIEAIEKESRAARRVFEQRIQKHKIIQETCEEDLLKMEKDYSAQRGKLTSKNTVAEKKRDEELSCLRSELDKNLLELKNAIASRRQQRISHSESLVENVFSEEVLAGLNLNQDPGSVSSMPPQPPEGDRTSFVDMFDQSSGVLLTSTTTNATGSSSSTSSPDKVSGDNTATSQLLNLDEQSVSNASQNNGKNYGNNSGGGSGSSSNSSSIGGGDTDDSGDVGGNSASIVAKGKDFPTIVDNNVSP